MIKVLESLDTNELPTEIQEVIDEILIPLDDHVVVQYVDETLMPDEISVDFAYEYEVGNEEYIGQWDIDMNKDNINNYSAYLTDISDEIDAAMSGFINEQ